MQWSFTSFHKQNFCAIPQSFSTCKSQDQLTYSWEDIKLCILLTIAWFIHLTKG